MYHSTCRNTTKRMNNTKIQRSELCYKVETFQITVDILANLRIFRIHRQTQLTIIVKITFRNVSTYQNSNNQSKNAQFLGQNFANFRGEDSLLWDFADIKAARSCWLNGVQFYNRIFPDRKNVTDQTCSCPRDWRLSASGGPN